MKHALTALDTLSRYLGMFVDRHGYEGAKTEGATFNRFGLFDIQDNHGKNAVVCFDDLEYTDRNDQLEYLTAGMNIADDEIPWKDIQRLKPDSKR